MYEGILNLVEERQGKNDPSKTYHHIVITDSNNKEWKFNTIDDVLAGAAKSIPIGSRVKYESEKDGKFYKLTMVSGIGVVEPQASSSGSVSGDDRQLSIMTQTYVKAMCDLMRSGMFPSVDEMLPAFTKIATHAETQATVFGAEITDDDGSIPF